MILIILSYPSGSNFFNAMVAMRMMLVQVFVNIGGDFGLIPSTGVTFPSSQGERSLVLLAVAFVLNIDASENALLKLY